MKQILRLSILFLATTFLYIQATEINMQKKQTEIKVINKSKTGNIIIFFGNSLTKKESAIPGSYLSENIPQNNSCTVKSLIKGIDYIVINTFDDIGRMHLVGQIGNNSINASKNSKEQSELEVEALNTVNIANAEKISMEINGTAQEGFVLNLYCDNDLISFPEKAFIKQ